jgi:thiol-disulfide isomerase/thioredoxin
MKNYSTFLFSFLLFILSFDVAYSEKQRRAVPPREKIIEFIHHWSGSCRLTMGKYNQIMERWRGKFFEINSENGLVIQDYKVGRCDEDDGCWVPSEAEFYHISPRFLLFDVQKAYVVAKKGSYYNGAEVSSCDLVGVECREAVDCIEVDYIEDSILSGGVDILIPVQSGRGEQVAQALNDLLTYYRRNDISTLYEK